MGKQMVRCPRDDRVAISAAMIHLLPDTTVDHGRFVVSCQHDTDAPKSVTISQFPISRPVHSIPGTRIRGGRRHHADGPDRRTWGRPNGPPGRGMMQVIRTGDTWGGDQRPKSRRNARRADGKPRLEESLLLLMPRANIGDRPAS